MKSAHSISTDSVAFNVQPRKTGQLLIGSSRQYGAEHSAIDAHMLTRMLRARAGIYAGARRNFRHSLLDRLPRRHARQASADRPVRCRSTPLPRHRATKGLGITTSLATGKLVADQILGRATAIPFEPYLPDRKHEEHLHA